MGEKMRLAEMLNGYGDPWLVALAAAVLGVVAAVVGTAVAAAILRRLVRFSVLLTSLLEHVVRPARFVVPLLVLQFIWSAAPADLPQLAFVIRTNSLLLVGALTWLLASAVSGVAAAIIRLHPASVTDNLEARRVHTQTRVLARTVKGLVILIGLGAALMTFPNVRQIGATLLASAGVAGLVAGIAARPVIGNLIAGLQIALTQPIRLDDVVIIEGEWGRIEEIGATYIVVKIWDERRLVVPLQWIIEHPFQNWTRRASHLLGTVYLWVDYRTSLAPLRAELQRVCKSAPEWDGRVALLQVVDANERAMQVRALVSSADASKGWDLRCRVREALIDFLQREDPAALPRVRAEIAKPAREHAPQEAVAPSEQLAIGDSTAIREAEHAGEHAPPMPASPPGAPALRRAT